MSDPHHYQHQIFSLLLECVQGDLLSHLLFFQSKGEINYVFMCFEYLARPVCSRYSTHIHHLKMLQIFFQKIPWEKSVMSISVHIRCAYMCIYPLYLKQEGAGVWTFVCMHF